MRILVMDEEVPYPLNSGKRIRTFNLFKNLAQRHEIIWISRRLEGVACDSSKFVELGIRTIILDDPVPRKSGVKFYFSLLTNLASPYPYVVSSHLSKKIPAAISRQLSQEKPFDLIHCEWTPYAVNMPDIKPCATIGMAHNVESMVWRRNQLVEKNPLKKLYIGHQARKMERFESQALPGFTRIVAVSEYDKEVMQQWVDPNRIAVVPNGVDIEYFRPGLEPATPGSLVFVGSLDWRPNIDCVFYFLDEIWPILKTRYAEASLSIVGRNPSPSLQSRIKKENAVSIHASVEDVRPYINRAEVCIVPLRIGSGSRLKILEALAMGKALVSTSIGAEGLDVEAGRHLLIEDRPEEFATAVIQLLKNPSQRHSLSVEGRQLVMEKYSWEMLSAQLESEWETAVRQNR